MGGGRGEGEEERGRRWEGGKVKRKWAGYRTIACIIQSVEISFTGQLNYRYHYIIITSLGDTHVGTYSIVSLLQP